jgi:uncharacterized protein
MKKTVLITGGSSGIGYQMSRYFAADGFHILWVSLSLEELEKSKSALESEINGVKIDFLQKDLSKTDAANEVYQWVKEKGFELDVLVNNAGFATFGYLQNIPLERELNMINLNVVNLYQMNRLFLEDMLKKDAGTIINISSNSSFQPGARINTYASTKAFVTSFSRGLQEELEIQKSRVKVITVCPSAIRDTAFKTTAKMENVKTFNGMAYTTSKEVSADIWKGYKTGKTFIVTGAKMRFFYAIRRLVPYSLQQYLVRKETETEN